jgi:hypothetical protein
MSNSSRVRSATDEDYERDFGSSSFLDAGSGDRPDPNTSAAEPQGLLRGIAASKQPTDPQRPRRTPRPPVMNHDIQVRATARLRTGSSTLIPANPWVHSG